MDKFTKLPTVESCRRIEFTTAEVVPGIINDTYFLVVSGTKSYLNMKVDLVPLWYVKQPEYWGIEVIGCLSGFGLPVLTPYTVHIPLDGIRGTKGIEVIGATSSQKIDIGGIDDRNLAFNAIANLKEDPPGLYVHGSVMLYRDDDKVEVTKAVPQGFNPAILVLDLKIIEGSGPMKGTPHPFCYKEHGCHTYTHVTMRYGKGQSQTVEVKILG